MTTTITIVINRHTIETDHGDRVYWSIPGESVSHDSTEAAVRVRAHAIVRRLADAGIPAVIKTMSTRCPFPRDW